MAGSGKRPIGGSGHGAERVIMSMGCAWRLSLYPAWMVPTLGSYGTLAVLLILGAIVAERRATAHRSSEA